METRPIRESEGVHLTRLFVSTLSNAFDIDVIVPDSHHLMNYEVPYKDGAVVVLDPYGDELEEEIRKQVFGKYPQWSVAICKKTGQIYIALYVVEEDGTRGLLLDEWESNAVLDRRAYVVPRNHRRQLFAAIRSSKRPYRLHIHPQAAEMVIIREQGWDHLRSNVVFSFDLGPRSLEVWGNSYRIVHDWK
jgi:hypothetical protein